MAGRGPIIAENTLWDVMSQVAVSLSPQMNSQAVTNCVSVRDVARMNAQEVVGCMSGFFKVDIVLWDALSQAARSRAKQMTPQKLTECEV